ncbi:hypothetical protein [Cognatishimia activa]|uniref:hypothetical protein n=1 Tax=Cognatishimia activa TaxID=1715691 RepID=UPI0022303975|nr:hypothetical protein [Cognatishimia activa]UZD89882.1 hypothetical protein M0D42_09795 [Cognatishimia activa]
MKLFKKFAGDEDGAVTVDWVALTAGLVGLSILALTLIGNETTQQAADIAATIENEDVTGLTLVGVSGGD